VFNEEPGRIHIETGMDRKIHFNNKVIGDLERIRIIYSATVLEERITPLAVMVQPLDVP
jgi:hypothetical protein